MVSCIFDLWLQDSMKQTYERSLKHANDYGFLKDSPEYVSFHMKAFLFHF